MGVIIRNGVEYSGACETATAVNYDNSLSGLDAQTVQEAIDEVNESLEWKLVGSASGSNAINLPSEWKEIMYQLVNSNGLSLTNYIIRKMLDTPGVSGIFGVTASENTDGSSVAKARITITESSINTTTFHIGTNDYLKDSKLYVWYR